MKPKEVRQILNNLYNLLIEFNISQSDEDVLRELYENPDPFVDNHLGKIKLLSSKYNAISRKNQYHKLKEEWFRLRQLGIEEIKKLIPFEDVAQLQPLFRKYEELSKKDEASILEDQEFLTVLKALKANIEKNE